MGTLRASKSVPTVTIVSYTSVYRRDVDDEGFDPVNVTTWDDFVSALDKRDPKFCVGYFHGLNKINYETVRRILRVTLKQLNEFRASRGLPPLPQEDGI